MRRIAAATFVIAIATWTSVGAQESTDTPKPNTEIEQLLLQKGRVIVKDFGKLGTIGGGQGSMELKTVVVTSAGGDTVTRGLRIQVTAPYSQRATERLSFLDHDELDDFRQAVTAIRAQAEQWANTERDYTEVVFSTKGDFNFGFFHEGKRQQFFASAGAVSEVTAFFPAKAVAELEKILAQAQQDLAR